MLHHKNFDLLKQLIPGRYADLQTVSVGEGFLKPDAASIILERFQPLREDGEVANRRLRSHNLRRLISVFADGGCRITGEPIIFNSLGLLVDGRHRVTACLSSGVTVPVLVVMGVNEECYDLIDQGATRSAGDILSAMGRPNYRALAAAAGSLWGFQFTGRLDKFNQLQKAMPRPATSDDLIRLLDLHPGLEDSVSEARNLKHATSLLGTQGPMSVAHYLMRKVDPALTEGVFTALNAQAVELSRMDKTLTPALQVREWLDKRDKQDKTKHVEKAMAYLVKAWNHIRTGMYERRVVWSENERFPHINGIAYREDGQPVMSQLTA